MNSSQQYLLPALPEDEKVALAAIVQGKLPVSRMTASDFGGSANRLIFEVLAHMHREQGDFDTSTIPDELDRDASIANSVSKAYLSELSSLPVDVTKLGSILEALQEKGLVRRLAEEAEEIASKGRKDQYGDLLSYLDASASAVYGLVNRHKPSSMRHVEESTLDSFNEISESARKGKRPWGLETGFRRLDQLMCGLHAGDLVVLAARPGMGKTSLALNIAVNTAHLLGSSLAASVLVLSLESPADVINRRMLCSEARVDSSRMRNGMLSREDWPHLAQAAGMLSKLNIFVDDTPRLTMSEVCARAERMKSRGLTLLVIDYVQLIRPDVRGETREREATEISRSLKQLARHLQIPVLAISQLNRGPEGRKNRHHRPQLSDLRDTGALEEDADVVLFVYRDEIYNPETLDQGIAEIIVAKQRQGPTGTRKVRFFEQYYRFDNLVDEDS